MKNKILFIVAFVGILVGVFAAGFLNRQHPPLKPVFNPAPNPFAKGIYATGMIESYQTNGENINIYPEIQGRVTAIFVKEGQKVNMGDPILMMDDSIQKATTEQQKALAASALSGLEELKAQPRKEVLDVAKAQMDASRASLKNVTDQLSKLKKSYHLNRQSVSKDALDNAINAVNVAEKNLKVTTNQYQLTKAGAWSFDIKNQEEQYNAFNKAAHASQALLEKYTIRAPSDGLILSIQTAIGSFISTQGSYETYTEGFTPAVVMGGSEDFLQIRCYVDEILINKLPHTAKMKAEMFIRGTDTKISLEYVRIQPYVSPKINLSNQRQERVDVRVLPVIFKFAKPAEQNIFPGQLVDVYIGSEDAPPQRVPASKESGT